MSNSRVETRVLTPAGDLSFEEYFVQRWYQDPVESVRFAGASDAEPAPGVIEAIRSADVVLLAPSNPVTSIAPILAVPGIREALRESRARIVAVSPIVGGAAVTGPAGTLHGGTRLRGFDRRRGRVLSRLPRPAGGRFAGRRRLLKNCARPACACIALRPSCAKYEDRIALAKSVLEAAMQPPTAQSAVERA